MNVEQNSLFPNFEDECEREWKDMPQYVSTSKQPYQQIIVSFSNFDDVKEFARLLGIKTITPKTDCSWFPPKQRDDKEIYVNKNWGKDEE